MKFQKILFFLCFSASMVLFTNCTDPDIVPKAEENTFNVEGGAIYSVDVVSGFFNLGDIPNAYYGSTLVTAGDAVSSGEVFISRNGGAQVKLQDFGSFPADLNISLTDAATAVGIAVEDVAVGDVFTLRFRADGANDTGKVVSIVATCSSALAGEYAYSTVDYFCDGDAVTGTATLTETDPGKYTWDDWAFGTYQACYGGPAAGWGSLELQDICNTLSINGLDGYDDTWSYSDISVDGNLLTFTWTNTYGEVGTTTLTNAAGDWPPLK